MREVHELGPISVAISVGDITETKADAIVNAANDHLWMGGGVAGAIKRKGGAEIEKEARAKGPIPVGSAVETGAGALGVRYVIHAATMGQDLKTGEAEIRNATKASLQKAVDLGLESLAMPALGTGVGGFSLEDAGRVMLEEVMGLGEYGSLSRIEVLLFDAECFESFMCGVRKVLPGCG